MRVCGTRHFHFPVVLTRTLAVLHEPQRTTSLRPHRYLPKRRRPAAKGGGVAGSGVLFKQATKNHSPWHDGEVLTSGLKYLMRTDVVYVAAEAPAAAR